MLTFNQLKKNLKKDTTAFKKVKLAILADSASQLIHQAVKGYGIEAGIDLEIYEADYNQIERQIFDPSSELYGFKPDFIFICRSTEHLIKEFYKSENSSGFAGQVTANTRSLYEQVSSALSCKVIVNTYVEINDAVFGNYAVKTDRSFIYQLRKLNLQLMELSQELKNLFLCDLAALSSTMGYQNTFDAKMYINADIVFNLDFLPYLAKSLTDIVQAISGSFKKCLILDLDNTTWGGIIGDDGIEGILIGSLGIGKAFTELQLWAKQLKKRGIILAISSKNTESIAKEPFSNHPDMVLRLEDIAIFVATWENKVDNIRHIQQVLNIGFDSMVFLDDNKFEREMVKQGIPDLTVPDLPEDPAEYLLYLRAQNLFETASLTEEDEQRTQLYQQEAQRTILQKSFENEDEFLQSMEMKSVVRPFDKFTIPRVSQLSQRSNQFNLRTIRYTEEEITKIASSEDYFTLSLTLEDKFGDHGLIAVIILKKENPDTLFIETWIMSCRVLKRGMESFSLKTIVDLALKNCFKKIVGEYLPTKKNALVKDHYQNLGFTHKLGKHELETANFVDKTHFIINKE